MERRQTLKFTIRTTLALGILVWMLAGCGVSQSECRDAATAQVMAEMAWAAIIDTHNAAHAAGVDHTETEDALVSSRVDLIMATETVRRACR